MEQVLTNQYPRHEQERENEFCKGIAKKQHERLSERYEEYTEFISWILNQKEWDNQLVIIKGKEYTNFMESDDKNDVMDMETVDSNNIYKEFKRILGVDIFNEEEYFVSAKYIDRARNDINLIVEIDGNNERFIIGV